MLSRFKDIVLLPQHHNAIYQRLGFLWGSQECRTYLLHLISDSKTKEGGDRVGWPPDVASELSRLLELHDHTFPDFDSSQEHGTPFKAYHPDRAQQLPNPPPKGGWLVLVITLTVIFGTLYWVATS